MVFLVGADDRAAVALAAALSCWARSGSTMDSRIVFRRDCLTGGYFIPPEVCADYGPLPFTVGGETIDCMSEAGFVVRAEDIPVFDPATCEIVEEPLPQLGTPTGFATTSIDDTSASFSWDAVDDADGYVLAWRTLPGGEWEEMFVSGTSGTVEGLADNTTYSFRVKAAADGYRDSEWSANINLQTGAEVPQLDVPQNLVSTDVTDSSIAVQWDAVADATGYVVAIRFSPLGSWTEFAVSGTSHEFDGLLSQTEYDIRVRATGEGFLDSDWSTILTVTTSGGSEQLDAPQNVSAGNVTQNSLDLSWDAVFPAQQYLVQIRLTGDESWFDYTVTSDITVPVTGLQPGTSYDFQVIAQAEGFIDSFPSDVLSVSTLQAQLDAPTGFVSTAQTTTSVDLSWDAVTDATGYVVEWRLSPDGAWTALPETGDTTATVSGLTADTEYQFQVKAVADGFEDSDWSGPITVSTQMEQLDAPTGLSMTGNSSSSISMEWDAVADATGYVLSYENQDDPGNWVEIVVSGTSETVEGLSPHSTYNFRVKATASGFVDSEWSATVAASTMGFLDSPQNLVSPSQTSSSISVSWDAVMNAEGYELEWRFQGDTEWTTISTTSTSHEVTGLDADSAYDFRVRATAVGFEPSDWSGILTASTGAGQLATPQNLVVVSTTTSSANLSWDAVAGATGYVVRYRIGFSAWTEVVSVSAGTTVTALTDNTTYEFQVKATGDTIGDSDWSDSATGQTDPSGSLSVPGNLAVSVSTSTTITLVWGPVLSATSYTLQYWSEGGAIQTVVVGAVSSHMLTGLMPSTTYQVRIKAHSLTSQSPWSGLIEVSTTAL